MIKGIVLLEISTNLKNKGQGYSTPEVFPPPNLYQWEVTLKAPCARNTKMKDNGGSQDSRSRAAARVGQHLVHTDLSSLWSGLWTCDPGSVLLPSPLQLVFCYFSYPTFPPLL